MHPIKIVLISLLISAASVPALEVSGTVTDKVDRPLPGAAICLLGGASNCVYAKADGSFQFSTPAGMRGNTEKSPQFRARLAGGRLMVTSRFPDPLQWQWYDSRGKGISSGVLIFAADKAQREIGMPESSPKGLYYLRLSGNRGQAVYMAAFTGGELTLAGGKLNGGSGNSSSLARISATPRTLEFSRAGYQTDSLLFWDEGPETGLQVELALVGDNGSPVTMPFGIKVEKIDRTSGYIIVANKDYECQGDVLMETTRLDSSRYAVRDGGLWIWTDTDCAGILMNGTSTDIVGKWQLNSFTLRDLPPDLKSPGCQALEGAGLSPGFTAVYDIRPDSIKAELTYAKCPGDEYLWEIEDAFSQDNSIEIVENTCFHAAFRNGAGMTATVDYIVTGDTTRVRFASGGSQCLHAVNESFFDETPPICPIDEEDGFLPLKTCIGESGFVSASPLMGLKKPGAARPPAPMAPKRLFGKLFR